MPVDAFLGDIDLRPKYSTSTREATVLRAMLYWPMKLDAPEIYPYSLCDAKLDVR
jgi:hypothetical protein